MLESHPLRLRLVDEMHMRRMPALGAPVEMVQTLRLVDPADRQAERAHVLTMPGVPATEIETRPRDANGRTASGIEMIWERHSEASTTTMIAPTDDGHGEGCAPAGVDAALAWLETAPGAVLRATRITIVTDEAAAKDLLPDFAFHSAELVSCRIGPTRIWSDFKLKPDGYGRLLVAAGGMSPPDLGRTVQRVQELGNYRNLALLGLPLAQAEGARLGELENRLGAITNGIAGASAGVEAALLDELCEVAAEAAKMAAGTSYRMSATQAYAEIAHDRLSSLASRDIAGFQSLADFTDRRMLPAVRTCVSFVTRVEALSVRIERTTSLLRTRVDLAMQASNAELLRSMDANAARQLKLQHLVEGLSVIAVSYYAFSLLAKLFPVAGRLWGWSEDWLQAVLIVPVVVTVALYLRWRSHRLVRDLD